MLVILPAYNEERNIGKLLDKLNTLKKKIQFDILVINDGSTDKTGEIAQNYDIEVLTHDSNEGLGKSLYDGFKRAIEKNEDIIITMDADDTMDIGLIDIMKNKIKTNDIVIASRYVNGAIIKNVPLYRRILSKFASFISSTAFHINAKDFSSGYRAYNVDCIKKAVDKWGKNFITSKGFDCQIEILRKVLPFASKICEIPIKLDYKNKINSSHFNFFKTFKGYTLQLFGALKGE